MDWARPLARDMILKEDIVDVVLESCKAVNAWTYDSLGFCIIYKT